MSPPVVEKKDPKRAAELWFAKYGRGGVWASVVIDGKTVSAEQVHDELVRSGLLFGDKMTAEDVVRITDGRLWLERCGGCGSKTASVVQVGEALDYESATAWLCKRCVREAMDALGEDASGDAVAAALIGALEDAKRCLEEPVRVDFLTMTAAKVKSACALGWKAGGKLVQELNDARMDRDVWKRIDRAVGQVGYGEPGISVGDAVARAQTLNDMMRTALAKIDAFEAAENPGLEDQELLRAATVWVGVIEESTIQEGVSVIGARVAQASAALCEAAKKRNLARAERLERLIMARFPGAKLTRRPFAETALGYWLDVLVGSHPVVVIDVHLASRTGGYGLACPWHAIGSGRSAWSDPPVVPSPEAAVRELERMVAAYAHNQADAEGLRQAQKEIP